MEHATDSHGSMNELTVAPQQILTAGVTKIFFFFNDSFDTFQRASL